MEKILFFPDKHKYIRESDGMQLMSVSHFRKLFESTNWVHNVRKAAAQEYLKATAYKKHKDAWEANGRHILDPAFIDYLMKFMDKKTFEQVCLNVRAAWDAKGESAAADGTLEHAREEDGFAEAGFAINPYNNLEYPTQPHGKKEDGTNCNIVESLSELEPGFYSELMLWHFFPEPIHSQSLGVDICGVCGTSDKVFLDDVSYVGDFKFTTKPLTDFSVEYKNFGREYHTGPFHDWPQSKLSGYRIQLNTYGWMLEQHGRPPVDLRIHNKVLTTGQQQEFVLPYVGDIIEEAMDMVFIESL